LIGGFKAPVVLTIGTASAPAKAPASVSPAPAPSAPTTAKGPALASASATVAVAPKVSAGSGFLKKGDFFKLSASGTINPMRIRFSQDSISPYFQDGSSVTTVAQSLKKGTIKASAFPPIRVVSHDSRVYTLDNRRLYAFQVAGVDIGYEKVSPKPVDEWNSKYTTKNNGASIRVR
jgi:hypothetical protein